jgi:methyl-accepting chemotaxis protein
MFKTGARSIRFQLMAAGMATVIAGIIVVALVVESVLGEAVVVLQDALDTKAATESTQLAGDLAFAVAANAAADIDERFSRFRHDNPTVMGLVVVSAAGAPVRETGEPLPAPLLATLRQPKVTVERHDSARYVGAPIRSEDKIIGHVMVADENRLAEQLRTHTRSVLVLTYGLLIAFSLAAMYWIGRRFAAPVGELVEAARELAAGNLATRVVTTGTSEEMVRLAGAVEKMGEALRSQVALMTEASKGVSEESSHVMGATSQLASAAAQQASSIAETTATVEELKQTSKTAMESARTIVSVSDKSLAVSNDGLAAVDSSSAAIKKIFEQVETIVHGIDAVRAKVTEVDDIVATVTKVADQSNLLAVNASIEAAKAGEFGRGFAVVAQEVKNLAEQSSKATTQVRTTLGAIQSSIEDVVLLARAGRERAKAGVSSIENTGKVIRDLGQNITESATSAKQIAISANEQVVGLEQIAQAMTAINQAASENERSTQQVERGGRELNAMARNLEQLVARYKLSP